MNTSTNTQKQKSALNEILTWSVGRPDWQRDALRRILEKGSLAETDLAEIERICLAKHQIDISDSPAIPCVPLAQMHLPATSDSTESVSLISVGDYKNVNRLSPAQTIPLGAEIGLTVIYGQNGAGKSSYARVIKKACRARGVQPVIRSNAFVSSVPAKASAKIIFKVGVTNVQVTWVDGVVSDPRLANVYVFDASSAGHYVSEDSAAAFTPFGLDVLPTLSKACDAIDLKLKNYIVKQEQSIASTAGNWKYDANTKVGKLIQNLSASTKVADINAHAGLDETQTKRLQDLRDVLKADPLQKAKETRATVTRLDTFEKQLASIAVDLADDKIADLMKLLDEAKAADVAAKAFASGQFDSNFLIGTGTDLWRNLWDAAREFSISAAYIEKEFPVTTGEARCVLCQQEIESKAADRLAAFEVFATDKSQQLAATAEKQVVEMESKFASIAALRPELEKVDADLAGLSVVERASISDFVLKADERILLVKQCLSNRLAIPFSSIPSSPVSVIAALQVSLEARAKTEESAHDPETRKELVAERCELESREWLSGVKEDVITQIEVHKTIANLNRCRRDVSTTPITTKSSELAKQFVTDAFQKRFKDELQALGLRTLEVALEPAQGKKGETKFGLRLISATNHKVVDIASEGEQRCIALAAFLSELSQASHQSALVFDDPVSSLDHWHREKIASRLVVECKHRQVIVFTHDLVFLNDLLAFAEKAEISPNVLSLEWNNGLPGSSVLGLPWDSKSPIECLRELEQEQKKLSTQWNPQPNSSNVESMRHAYSRLRSTMERIVEKELLSGIVSRFESQIITGRIKDVVGIHQKEVDEVRRLVQKCHDITDAHAPSQAAIPHPIEFAKDIEDANALIGVIRARKKAAQVAVPT